MIFFKKTDIKQLLLLFIASVIVSFPYFLYNPKQGLMAVLLLMILAMVSKVVWSMVGIYSILINTLFLHLVTKWGKDSLVSRIQASYESATYERWEYFKAYVDMGDIVLMLAYVLSASFVIYWVFKKVKLSVGGKKISLITSIGAVAMSLFIFPTLETIKNFQLVHFPLKVYTTHQNLSIINERAEYLKTVKKVKVDCPNDFDKIIFIQGESVNKNNMSIYGYHRKTTPFFDEIKPYTFDAISPANQTRFAIPIELTDATVKDFPKFYKTQSIVRRLSDCGYATYWISNQGKTGEFDTTITSIAKEADHQYFLNDLDYKVSGLDENILNTLKKINTKTSKKQAFFIHLLGSHFSYSERYPVGKGYFKGDDSVTHYDNSIYYTDSIIKNIYEQFSNDNALYFYLSDHSEIAVEGKGHGLSPSFKDEYEVPLLIWSKKEKKLSNLYSDAKGKIINTESINHIIKYLVGIDDVPNISYSSKVLSVIPSNVVDYTTLPRYLSK